MPSTSQDRVVSRRTALAGLGTAGLGFALASSATAQDATPAASGVPPLQGVTFEVLSGGGEPAAASGQMLAFVRMTMDPDGFISVHGHPGAQIWYVETGAFSTTMLEGTMQVTRAADDSTLAPAEQLAAGAETILSAGDSAFFDADVLHTVRHAGDEPTVVLIPALFETGQQPLIFHAHDEATPAS